jgi:CubicO group peptidase (beta-lactamase class C family)
LRRRQTIPKRSNPLSRDIPDYVFSRQASTPQVRPSQIEKHRGIGFQRTPPEDWALILPDAPTLINPLVRSEREGDTVRSDMGITRRQFAYSVLASLFSSNSLQAASELLEKATSPGWFSPPEIDAAALDVCYGKNHYSKAYGACGMPERVFAISSISKPIVATGAMVLKDRGELILQDRAAKFLPEFLGDGRDDVTIQNLLTHTAGLPDSLPEFRQLLNQQAGLDEFFKVTCKVPLLFKPGSAVSYSNLGVLVVKEIMERITGVPLRQFLKTQVFEPLSMHATSLGLGGRTLESVAQNQIKEGGLHTNTIYRHELGSPWAGVHSTALDLTRLLHYFVNPCNSPLKPETAREMLRNHCEGLNQPWGVGWMLAHSHDTYYKIPPTWRRYGWSSLFSNPEQGPAFGVHCSPSAFGHYGVSGTIAWADPRLGISMVLLTTKSVRHSREGVLGSVSDLVAQL